VGLHAHPRRPTQPRGKHRSGYVREFLPARECKSASDTVLAGKKGNGRVLTMRCVSFAVTMVVLMSALMPSKKTEIKVGPNTHTKLKLSSLIGPEMRRPTPIGPPKVIGTLIIAIPAPRPASPIARRGGPLALPILGSVLGTQKPQWQGTRFGVISAACGAHTPTELGLCWSPLSEFRFCPAHRHRLRERQPTPHHLLSSLPRSRWNPCHPRLRNPKRPSSPNCGCLLRFRSLHELRMSACSTTFRWITSA
jgi:hypothetical protein